MKLPELIRVVGAINSQDEVEDIGKVRAEITDWTGKRVAVVLDCPCSI